MHTEETKLPPFIVEYKEKWEKEHGKPLSPAVVQIVAYFERLASAMKDLGKSDAQEGRKPLPFPVFYNLAKYLFSRKEDPRLPQAFAEVVHERYMDGYNKGKEAAQG